MLLYEETSITRGLLYYSSRFVSAARNNRMDQPFDPNANETEDGCRATPAHVITGYRLRVDVHLFTPSAPCFNFAIIPGFVPVG